MLLPTVEPSSDCCFNAYDEAPDYNFGDLHICSARSGMILSAHQVLIWLGLFGHCLLHSENMPLQVQPKDLLQNSSKAVQWSMYM